MEKKVTSIPDLFKKSWEVFVKVWKKYLLLYLFTFIGFIGIVAVSFGPTLAKLMTQVDTPERLAEEILTKGWPFIVLFFVLMIVFSSIVGLAINKIIFSAAEEKELTLKEAFSYAVTNFPSYLWVSFVTGLLVLAGFVLLIIPGLYAMFALIFVSAVFIAEEKHSLAALKRSREIVQPNFWFVVGRYLVIFAIIILVSQLTEKSMIISSIANFILSPISVAYGYFVYKDLK